MATAVTEEIQGSDDRSVATTSVEGSRWCEGKCSWRPTSDGILAAAEAKILQFIKTRYESKHVPIENQQKVWTLKFNPNASKVPLVLVHGFGGGAGMWVMNIDALAKGRTIYAIDVLGFGRSSRPKISSDPEEAEKEFVDSIEQWRHQLGLEKFVLLGHSFGGFLASSYTLKYPSRVQHLILVDSWGFPEKPPDIENDFPMWARVLKAVIMPFNPLAAIRAAGPWGPSLVQKFRPDFQRKFSRLLTEDDTILNYIYHCNAQKPSGEIAFKKMSESFGWAKFPMIHRIGGVDKNIPMTMIHGSQSWMDASTSYKTKYLRSSSYVDVQIIPEAGHHVYADQPDIFNLMVDKICRKEDEKIDVVVN